MGNFGFKKVFCIFLLGCVAQLAVAEPDDVVIYDSNGFEGSTGLVTTLQPGTWHPDCGLTGWTVDAFQEDPNSAVISLPDAGVHAGRGNVLSFPAESTWDPDMWGPGVGDWDYKTLRLNTQWAGGDYDEFGVKIDDGSEDWPRDVMVKWEFDMYQRGGCWGAIYTYRNSSQVDQVKILPQVGNFNAEIRPNSINADSWPSYNLHTYVADPNAVHGTDPQTDPNAPQWHHIEVYQHLSHSHNDIPGRVWIFWDGVELGEQNDWYSIWAIWTGYFDSIKFLPAVDSEISGSTYYIDNLKITYDPAPEWCGEPGFDYHSADVNHDCYVDLLDLAEMGQQWLSCTDPAGSGCDVIPWSSIMKR